MNGSGFATSQSLWKVNKDRCNSPKNVAPFETKVSFLFNDFETVGITYIFSFFSMYQYDPNYQGHKWKRIVFPRKLLNLSYFRTIGGSHIDRWRYFNKNWTNHMTLRLRKFSHNSLFRHHCSTLNQGILAWRSLEPVLNTISSIRIKQAIKKKGGEGEVSLLRVEVEIKTW